MEKIETFDAVIREWFQEEAEAFLERELTEDEFEDVRERVLGDLWMLIQDKIQEVIDYNDLLERNNHADAVLPHYQVLWKNENAYQKDYKVSRCFKSEDDAKQYIHSDFISEYDHYKIFLVDQGIEKEVYKIN